jgi:membrane-anchored protein YejM (alkaline phosphatase superfamily)
MIGMWRRDRPDPPRDGRSALVFAVVLPFAAALALLPGEFTHYKRWLELGTGETLLRLTVLGAILSKTFVALLGAIALLLLLARILRPRTLRMLSFGASLLVLGLIAVDLELQRNTGNNLAHYLPFLADPATFVWAGKGFAITPSFFELAARLSVAFLPACVLAWALERWVSIEPAGRGRIVLACILGVVLLVVISAPLLQRIAGSPAHLYQLSEKMPWAWNVGLRSRFAEIDERQAEAQRLFDQALPRLSEPRSFENLLAGQEPARRPDILLVVVESLRHDVLDAETMPRLWAASEMGARFDAHYATSNASHYGLFALLYGRSPLLYFETLDTEEAPTLPSRLHKWGYSTHHLTCSDIRWREMDRFMGSEHFSVERMRGTSFDACDRKVMSRATSLLRPGERPPRFILAFMMSTHFGYHFPAGAERFRPSAPPPNALELDATRDFTSLFNRYRNSAHHVDTLIGDLLDEIEKKDTLIIVTGDHGESLFDDGTIAHSSLLSEIQTRVPLVLIGQGVRPGSARRGPTDHSDLLPTLLGRLGVQRERLDAFPGRDLLEEEPSPFVALIQAKTYRGGENRIALVSPETRYSIDFDLDSGELLFLGRLRADGRPSRERSSTSEDAEAIHWLDHYLRSITHH